MIGRLPGRRGALGFGMAASTGGVLMGPVDRGESTDTTHSINPASALIACRPVRIAAQVPVSCQVRKSP